MRFSASLMQVLFALAIPVLLSSCTGNPGQSNATAVAPISGTDNAVVAEQAPSDAPMAALASTNPADYRISPHDSLQIIVFQVQDLNKTVTVNADGSISLPLIGKVPMAGKTTNQAEELIAGRLRKSYLQSPQVSVSVAKFGQRVTVSGAVKTPKVLNVDGQLTLSQAIANAGGLSELADTSRVHIARRTGGQSVQDNIYDLNAIQSGKTVDPMLQGGDLVVAEESGVRVAFKQVRDLVPFAALAAIF